MSRHPREIPPVPDATMRVARAAFPRGHNFKNDFIEVQTCSALKKPATTFGTVNFDYICEHDPGFHRPSACTRIRNAPWAD